MSGFLLSIIAQLVGAVLTFFVGMGLAYWWQNRKYRRLRHQIQRLEVQRKAGKAALAISIGEIPIEQAVMAYLKKRGMQEVFLETYHQPAMLTQNPADWAECLDKIKEKVRDLKQTGVTKLYLFLMMPVSLAVILGAILDNGPETIVYHYFNGVYQPIGRINAVTTKM